MNTLLHSFVNRFDVSFSDRRIKISEPYYRDNIPGELIVIYRDVYSYSLYAYSGKLFCTYLDVISWNRKYANAPADIKDSAPPPEIIIFEIHEDRSCNEIARIFDEKELKQTIESIAFPF